MNLWLSMLVAGCGSTPEARAPAEVEATTVGEVALPSPPHVRGWRRMDITQLDASIRKVTGGIGWDDDAGNPQFEALSRTLGVPDYLDSTIEDLTPSLLFQKFLDDAAHEVCDELLARERVSSPEGRVLLVGIEPTDTLETDRNGVEQALSRAVKRFHGRSVPPGDPELEPWTFLFESATVVTGDPEQAWHAVCVGLLTHPDFYTY